MPTVFNAANEKAVALFLDRKIAYLDIPKIIEDCMEEHKNISNPSLDEILAVEAEVYARITERYPS